MKEKRDDLLQCSSPHMALQTKTSHSGQISKGRGTSTAGIFHIMASFAPGNFLLGQNLKIFFSFEFLWHTQLIEVTCSHNELLWLLMCPKQIFELFSAAGPACPECTELCCAHTFFFSVLWHPEGHDSTAEVRHSTNNCTETGWISDFDPHQCPLDSPVHDMPLQCTKTHTLEGNHRKRCAVFVQKLIIDVSQTP